MTITDGRSELSYGHRDAVDADAVVGGSELVVRAGCVGGRFSLSDLVGSALVQGHVMSYNSFQSTTMYLRSAYSGVSGRFLMSVHLSEFSNPNICLSVHSLKTALSIQSLDLYYDSSNLQ